MTNSPHSVDDYLPSLSRPSAWETSNRNRQLVSPLLSDSGSVHSNEDYDQRTSGHAGVGWRRDEIPNHTAVNVAHNRRQFIEAQEQLRMYKEELAKKNRLIHELTSLETPRPTAFDTTRIDQMLDIGNAEALSSARSQVAALQVKVEGLHSQIRELNRQLESRDELIGELRAFKEASKDAESRQSAVILSLRQRILDYEAQHGALEGVASRSEHTLASLQREYNESQQQVLRLEADLRSCSEENSSLRRQREDSELRWNALTRKLSSCLELSEVTLQSEELIVSKVEKLLGAETANQSKVKALEKTMEGVQLELKANRETISRLSSEKEQLEGLHTQHTAEINTLRKELDSNESSRRQMLIDIDQLRVLVDQVTRERDASHLRIETLERQLSSRDEDRQKDHSRHSSTISHILSVLSSCDDLDAVSEATIVDQLKHLANLLRDKKSRVKLLERQLAELSADLESHRAELAAVGSADRIFDIEQRLVRAENELAAGDVLRDNLRADKEKYLKFLEHLGKVLVVNAIAVDVGLDGMSDAILARAEQLIKNEATEIADRKSHIFNLQRKLKIMKDQLDSKDVHMELLRKKTITLEERLTNKSDLEREKDEESVRSRKLMKLAEKYKRELNEAHVELRDMRARLLTTSELQAKDIRHQHEIERLESEVRRLDELCRKQAAMLSGLEHSVSTSTKKSDKRREETANTISALTSELRTTKQALEDVTSREQQLLDLRCVIARMLGLAIDTLAVPDYEVVTRLEQLILANQANAATAFALDSAISDLGDGFRSGYRGRMASVGGVHVPRGSQHAIRVPVVSSSSRAHRDGDLETRVS